MCACDFFQHGGALLVDSTGASGWHFARTVRCVPQLATVVLLLTTLWYLKMSISLAIGMVGVSAAMVGLCVGVLAVTTAPLWQTSLIVFVVAWIGQFIGHKIEGKKPSFFKDLQFLLVGPMWLMHFVYKRVGIAY